jgi:hypothetical protein
LSGSLAARAERAAKRKEREVLRDCAICLIDAGKEYIGVRNGVSRHFGRDLTEDEKVVISSMVEESMILIKDLNTGDVRKAIQVNSSPPKKMLIKNLDTGQLEESAQVSAHAQRFMYDSDASSNPRDSSPRTSENDPARLGLGNVISAPASVLAEIWWKDFLMELPNHICRRRKNSGPRPSTVYMHEFDRRPLGIMMTFADRPTQTGAQVHSIAKPEIPIDIGDYLVAINGELVTAWPTQVIMQTLVALQLPFSLTFSNVKPNNLFDPQASAGGDDDDSDDDSLLSDEIPESEEEEYEEGEYEEGEYEEGEYDEGEYDVGYEGGEYEEGEYEEGGYEGGEYYGEEEEKDEQYQDGGRGSAASGHSVHSHHSSSSYEHLATRVSLTRVEVEWDGETSLGLELVEHDPITGGVRVESIMPMVPGSAATSVQPGMLVLTVNGLDVSSMDFLSVAKALKAATRPAKIVFVSFGSPAHGSPHEQASNLSPPSSPRSTGGHANSASGADGANSASGADSAGVGSPSSARSDEVDEGAEEGEWAGQAGGGLTSGGAGGSMYGAGSSMYSGSGGAAFDDDSLSKYSEEEVAERLSTVNGIQFVSRERSGSSPRSRSNSQTRERSSSTTRERSSSSSSSGSHHHHGPSSNHDSGLHPAMAALSVAEDGSPRRPIFPEHSPASPRVRKSAGGS